MTRLSVIVVSYKVRDLLIKSLQSIFAAGESLSLEVIVVDNASNDGTVEKLSRDFSSVKVIANERNEGFPKANNQALRICTGDIILLLNPDTILDREALVALKKFFDSQSGGAIAGLNQRKPDGSYQSCAHSLPNLRSLIFSVFRLDRKFQNNPTFNSYGYAGVEPLEQRHVGYVSGAALAFNRTVLEKLCGLDENMFWWEDLDFCCRAWEAGFGVFFLPDAKAIHYVGQSAKHNLRRVLYHQHVSRVQYFRKHFNGLTARVVELLTLSELAGKAAIRMVQYAIPRHRPESSIRLAGYLDAVRFLTSGQVQRM